MSYRGRGPPGPGYPAYTYDPLRYPYPQNYNQPRPAPDYVPWGPPGPGISPWGPPGSSYPSMGGMPYQNVPPSQIYGGDFRDHSGGALSLGPPAGQDFRSPADSYHGDSERRSQSNNSRPTRKDDRRTSPSSRERPERPSKTDDRRVSPPSRERHERQPKTDDRRLSPSSRDTERRERSGSSHHHSEAKGSNSSPSHDRGRSRSMKQKLDKETDRSYKSSSNIESQKPSLNLDELLQDERLKSVLFAGICKATAKLEQSLKGAGGTPEKTVDNIPMTAPTPGADSSPKRPKSILKRKTGAERKDAEDETTSLSKLSTLEKTLQLLRDKTGVKEGAGSSEEGSRYDQDQLVALKGALGQLASYGDKGGHDDDDFGSSDRQDKHRTTQSQTHQAAYPFWSVDALSKKEAEISDVQERLYQQWRQSINQGQTDQDMPQKDQLILKEKPDGVLSPSTKNLKQAEDDDEELDSTVQNILHSIGFNFDLSKRMQELARAKKKKQDSFPTGIINQSATFLGSSEELVHDVRAALFSNNQGQSSIEREPRTSTLTGRPISLDQPYEVTHFDQEVLSPEHVGRASNEYKYAKLLNVGSHKIESVKSHRRENLESLSPTEEDWAGAEERDRIIRMFSENSSEMKRGFPKEKDARPSSRSRHLNEGDTQSKKSVLGRPGDNSDWVSERLWDEPKDEYFYPEDEKVALSTAVPLLTSLSSRRKEHLLPPVKISSQSGLTHIENLRVTSKAGYGRDGQPLGESRTVILPAQPGHRNVSPSPGYRSSLSPVYHKSKSPTHREASGYRHSRSPGHMGSLSPGYKTLHSLDSRNMKKRSASPLNPRSAKELKLQYADRTDYNSRQSALERSLLELKSSLANYAFNSSTDPHYTSTMPYKSQQIDCSHQGELGFHNQRESFNWEDGLNKFLKHASSRSPPRQKSRSPAHYRSRSISQRKSRSTSLSKRRSISPRKYRSRSRSPGKMRSFSPRKSWSPGKRRSVSPRMSRSPGKRRSRSPRRQKYRSRSPRKSRSRSPKSRRSVSPVDRQSTSHIRRKSRSKSLERHTKFSGRSQYPPQKRYRSPIKEIKQARRVIDHRSYLDKSRDVEQKRSKQVEVNVSKLPPEDRKAYLQKLSKENKPDVSQDSAEAQAVRKLTNFSLAQKRIILLKMAQMSVEDKEKLLGNLSIRQDKISALKLEQEKLKKEQNEIMRRCQRSGENSTPLLLESTEALEKLAQKIKSLYSADLVHFSESPPRLPARKEEKTQQPVKKTAKDKPVKEDTKTKPNLLFNKSDKDVSLKMADKDTKIKSVSLKKSDTDVSFNKSDKGVSLKNSDKDFPIASSDKHVPKTKPVETLETKVAINTQPVTSSERVNKSKKSPSGCQDEKPANKEAASDGLGKQAKDVDVSSTPSQLLSKQQVYYEYCDAGHHWCVLCSTSYSSVDLLFQHKHSKKHLSKISDETKPWKNNKEKKPKARKVGLSQSRTIRGAEMMYPVSGFYCSLCKVLCWDFTDSFDHLKTDSHYDMYMKYVQKNPLYEKTLLLEKTKALGNRKLKQDLPDPSGDTIKPNTVTGDISTVSDSDDYNIVDMDVDKREDVGSIMQSSEIPSDQVTKKKKKKLKGVKKGNELDLSSIPFPSEPDTTLPVKTSEKQEKSEDGENKLMDVDMDSGEPNLAYSNRSLDLIHIPLSDTAEGEKEEIAKTVKTDNLYAKLSRSMAYKCKPKQTIPCVEGEHDVYDMELKIAQEMMAKLEKEKLKIQRKNLKKEEREGKKSEGELPRKKRYESSSSSEDDSDSPAESEKHEAAMTDWCETSATEEQSHLIVVSDQMVSPHPHEGAMTDWCEIPATENQPNLIVVSDQMVSPYPQETAITDWCGTSATENQSNLIVVSDQMVSPHPHETAMTDWCEIPATENQPNLSVTLPTCLENPGTTGEMESTGITGEMKSTETAEPYFAADNLHERLQPFVAAENLDKTVESLIPEENFDKSLQPNIAAENLDDRVEPFIAAQNLGERVVLNIAAENLGERVVLNIAAENLDERVKPFIAAENLDERVEPFIAAEKFDEKLQPNIAADNCEKGIKPFIESSERVEPFIATANLDDILQLNVVAENLDERVEPVIAADNLVTTLQSNIAAENLDERAGSYITNEYFVERMQPNVVADNLDEMLQPIIVDDNLEERVGPVFPAVNLDERLQTSIVTDNFDERLQPTIAADNADENLEPNLAPDDLYKRMNTHVDVDSMEIGTDIDIPNENGGKTFDNVHEITGKVSDNVYEIADTTSKNIGEIQDLFCDNVNDMAENILEKEVEIKGQISDSVYEIRISDVDGTSEGSTDIPPIVEETISLCASEGRIDISVVSDHSTTFSKASSDIPEAVLDGSETHSFGESTEPVLAEPEIALVGNTKAKRDNVTLGDIVRSVTKSNRKHTNTSPKKLAKKPDKELAGTSQFEGRVTRSRAMKDEPDPNGISEHEEEHAETGNLEEEPNSPGVSSRRPMFSGDSREIKPQLESLTSDSSNLGLDAGSAEDSSCVVTTSRAAAPACRDPPMSGVLGDVEESMDAMMMPVTETDSEGLEAEVPPTDGLSLNLDDDEDTIQFVMDVDTEDKMKPMD